MPSSRRLIEASALTFKSYNTGCSTRRGIFSDDPRLHSAQWCLVCRLLACPFCWGFRRSAGIGFIGLTLVSLRRAPAAGCRSGVRKPVSFGRCRSAGTPAVIRIRLRGRSHIRVNYEPCARSRSMLTSLAHAMSASCSAPGLSKDSSVALSNSHLVDFVTLLVF